MTGTIKENPAALDTDVLASMRGMFMTIPRLQASGLELLLKHQKEMFEFMAHRCDRDMEFVAQLSHVKDVSGVPDIISSFMRSATTEYAEEARKSVDAGSRAATEFAEQLRDIQSDSAKLAA